jgi:hypothetical protein
MSSAISLNVAFIQAVLPDAMAAHVGIRLT